MHELLPCASNEETKESSSTDYSGDRIVRRAKHREGYNVDWNSTHGSYLLPIAINQRKFVVFCVNSASVKVTRKRGAGTWVSKPCTVLRKDMIDHHGQSNMHEEAIECKARQLWNMKQHG